MIFLLHSSHSMKNVIIFEMMYQGFFLFNTFFQNLRTAFWKFSFSCFFSILTQFHFLPFFLVILISVISSIFLIKKNIFPFWIIQKMEQWKSKENNTEEKKNILHTAFFLTVSMKFWISLLNHTFLIFLLYINGFFHSSAFFRWVFFPSVKQCHTKHFYNFDVREHRNNKIYKI